MPFGLIFGAVFFGLFCTMLGLRWLLHPTPEAKLGGALLVILGGSLALGLLMRRQWARWTGVAVGLLLAVAGLRLVAIQGGVFDHVLLLTAVAVALLLAIPVTGDAARGALTAAGARESRVVGPVGWTALASLLGLVAVGFSVENGATPTGPDRAGGLPASAIARSVRWTDFEEGMARAQAEGKPMLATFVTDWCPYCTKMNRSTWRASSVTERLERLVTIRVNVEEPGTGGFSGPELAERYGVEGYPVQLLLDVDGRPIARANGYQSPRELLAWIDDALPDERGTPRVLEVGSN